MVCRYYDPDPANPGEDTIIFCQAHYQKLPADNKLPRFGNGTGGDIEFKKSQLMRAKHNTPLVSEQLVARDLLCIACTHLRHLCHFSSQAIGSGLVLSLAQVVRAMYCLCPSSLLCV
jgi:hypothetical protein